MITGWKLIAERLSRITGFEITAEQARHWARREADPLPVRRIGRLRRPLVVVALGMLEQWARREFGV